MFGEMIFIDLMYCFDENKVFVLILMGEFVVFLVKGGKIGGWMNFILIGFECVSMVFLGVCCFSIDGGYFFEMVVWLGYDYKIDEVMGILNIVVCCLIYE